MTLTLFLILLPILATFASLLTEAIKKLFADKSYASNILVLIVALVVGVSGTLVAYYTKNIQIRPIDIFFAICMGISVWLVAMLGYDKVKQAIEQLLTTKGQ